MRCRRCRAKVELGSAQCQRCGRPLIDPGTPAAASPAPPSPVGTSRQQRDRRPGGTTKAGCACLVPALVLAFGLPVLAGIVGIVSGRIDPSGGTDEEGTLVLGEQVRGGLGTDETGRWLLDGVGSEVVVTVHGRDDFDPEVEVHVRGGGSLGDDDDSGPDRDAQLIVRLRDGQDYEVDVTEFSGSGGDYEILVDRVEGEGGSLVVRRPVDGTVATDRRVRYTFAGEGREVTVTVRGRDGFDPTVVVSDPDGRQLASADDTIGLDPQVRVFVPGGQTVVVEVAGFGDEGGSYTVEVA